MRDAAFFNPRPDLTKQGDVRNAKRSYSPKATSLGPLKNSAVGTIVITPSPHKCLPGHHPKEAAAPDDSVTLHLEFSSSRRVITLLTPQSAQFQTIIPTSPSPSPSVARTHLSLPLAQHRLGRVLSVPSRLGVAAGVVDARPHLDGVHPHPLLRLV